MEELEYEQRLVNYYQTAADNYEQMFGRTIEWHEMNRTAVRARQSYERRYA